MNEPTEQDQHELQTRLDMREAAEDALRMYAEAKYATSSRMAAAVLAKHVLTLLDEDEQVCIVATEITRQVEKVIDQRDRMAELLRKVAIDCKSAGLTETQRSKDYVRVSFSSKLIDEINEVIK